jgi:ribosomal-protein-alanine N-acetyltransferase
MDDVTLRPIEEADLDALRRYATDPDASGEFEWAGFKDPNASRRRWEQDGYLGAESTWLAAVSGGSFAGIVTFKDRSPGVSEGTSRLYGGAIYEMGIALLPEHRGRGVGTAAQRLLVDYLFATTPAHRLQALTEVENLAEQRSLEKVGFEREGVFRRNVWRAGRWRDTVLYSLLRD